MDISSPQYMVYQALQCACSQNTDLLKSAETKLAEWEKEHGFYTTLLTIIYDHSIDVNVRWMAAVCFKNGIDKYWRRNIPNEINMDEKITIRSTLIGSFNEPVPQIAVQIAVIISKIARLDYPKQWTEVVPTLLEAVKSNDQLLQHRSLLVLQQVIKALSSKRLINDRKQFEQLTQNVYSFVLNLWDAFTTLYFQSIRENSSTELSQTYIEKAILSLRILRKLTIYGFSHPHKSEDCMMFIKAIFQRLKESLECRLQVKMRSQDTLADLTEKFILKQTKILNEFLEQHPFSFIDFISTSLEFSFNFVFHEGTSMIFEGSNVTFTNFVIHCINLMKGILSSNAYNAVFQKSVSPDITKAFTAKQEFFTEERLSYICEKIIMHYFLLTQEDLDFWDADPESYAIDEGGESWIYALRPCTESFFLTLFKHFRTILFPEILKYVQKAQCTILNSDSDLKDILIKDAIYNAAGITAFNLFEDLNFDEWFPGQLSDELKIKSNNFRIIRRRVIWLIGKWTEVKFSRSLRPQVYSACLELIQPTEDMSVRLAASRTLKAAMDDFDFESSKFLEYLEPAISLLFILLKDAKECDTKLNVLYIMSFIVEKMDENIQSQADNLMQYLPMLWEESKDHNMLRCAIITTLIQLVKATCNIPNKLIPFLYSIIGTSTNVNDPSHVYLLEEGLELWLVFIENSTQLNSELLELSSNIFPIIEMSSEQLRTCLYIIQSYILLNPDIYLQRFGKAVVTTCAYLITDLRPEGIGVVMKLFEAFLRSKPEYGIELLKPILPDIFRKVYEDKEYPLVMTTYLSIVSRILLLDQVVFSNVLQEMNITQSLEKILDAWIAKMPLVTQLEKRKLLSLALASLLTVQNDSIFERFGGILLNISEVLNDIMKEEDTELGVFTDSLVLTESADLETSGIWNEGDFEYKTYHYERCRDLCLRDPVHTIVLKDYIQSQLVTLKSQIGNERYHYLLSHVDEVILKNLSYYINVGIEIDNKSK